jgi:magnesium transporter
MSAASLLIKSSVIFQNVDAEQLLEISDTLPSHLLDIAVAAMGKQQRKFFQDASQYKDAQIGHWLSHDLLVLPINAKVSDGLRLLRRELPETTECIFLLNRAGQFSAAVKLSSLFGEPPHLPLVELSEESISVVKNKVNAKRMVERASNGIQSMSLSVEAMQNVTNTVTQAR